MNASRSDRSLVTVLAAEPIAPATTPTSSAPPDSAPLRGRVLGRSNLPAILALAARLHDEGHLDEAERLYRQVLDAAPESTDVLHMLGVLYHQRGEHDRAIGCLTRCGERHARDAGFFRHLGEVYRALLRFDEAVESFERALEIEPEDSDALCNLGHANLQRGACAAAADCYRRAVGLAPDDAEAHTCLGVALGRLDRPDEAGAAFRRALTIDPLNDEARHMLAALTGHAAATAPRSYVTRLFDRYADSFDRELVADLGYDVPRRLRLALTAVCGGPVSGWRVADLGCGTGLCGEAFRDVADHLVGVDLSPRMLEQARSRGIYDELVADDLAAILDPDRLPFDLVLAADVLIYVGDLDDLFARVAAVLRDGGFFAFSTERTGPDDDPEAEHVLRPTGRFAHADASVRRLAERHGFDLTSFLDVDIRLDAGVPIPGRTVVLRRHADASD